MRSRPRPRPITVKPRPRPKKWSRDHVGLETLTSLMSNTKNWLRLFAQPSINFYSREVRNLALLSDNIRYYSFYLLQSIYLGYYCCSRTITAPFRQRLLLATATNVYSNAGSAGLLLVRLRPSVLELSAN